MSKRAERSSSSSSTSKPSPKRNRQRSEEMDGDQNSDTHISMEIVLDKLSSMESRMEDNFSNLHAQIAALNSEFKEELNGVKVTIKELEKSLNNAWAFIEDIQSEAKALKDSKSSQQQMLEEQAAQIKTLEANLTNLVTEINYLRPTLTETQQNLTALENYTRRDNLRFMNIPESRGEDCQDIIYDLIENDLKINAEDIRFHAMHCVGKSTGHEANAARPRPIIARFVVREDRDAVLAVKNRLKSSKRYHDAYITQDFARAIQKERKTLIQAMFVAKKAGREAKVINRSLFIDNKVYDISNIPTEFKAPHVQNAT